MYTVGISAVNFKQEIAVERNRDKNFVFAKSEFNIKSRGGKDYTLNPQP